MQAARLRGHAMRLDEDMTMRNLLQRCIATLVLVGGMAAIADDVAARRFAVGDMFALEGFGILYGGPVSVSPDGRALAFTKLRTRGSQRDFQQNHLWDNGRGDIWVQSQSGEPPVRITRGVEEGVGYWAPLWSPDGDRIALLSSKGDSITPWVWERKSGKLTQLTTRGIEQSFYRPYHWIDAYRLLVSIVPAGVQPEGFAYYRQSTANAARGWEQARRGADPTASVLQSGVATPPEGSSRQLVLIDVRTGAGQVVGEGADRGIRLAPDLSKVAYCRDIGRFKPRPDQKVPSDANSRTSCALEIRNLQGNDLAEGVRLPQDVLADSLNWSPDGRKLTLLAYESRDRAPKLYQYDLSAKALVDVPIPGLDAMLAFVAVSSPVLYSTGSGKILVQAIKRGADGSSSAVRRDWWLVGTGASPRNLTSRFQEPPRQLWPEHGQRSFVGAADGEVWRLNEHGGLENLTAEFAPTVSRISWPNISSSSAGNHGYLEQSFRSVVFSANGEETVDYVLDLDTHKAARIAKPSPDAVAAAYSPQGRVIIYQEESKSGMHLWRSHVGSGGPEAVVEGNAFLGGVAEGEFRAVDYVSRGGERLKAWLLLPYNYQPGRRYPLVTWVYAGKMQGQSPPRQTIGYTLSSDTWNMQVLSAYGYAVLFPSMPLKPVKGGRESEEIVTKLPDGVLPAVDEVIRLGFADPKRLALMGHSYGGYSTYGLLTQTQKFKVAIASAGPANLISMWGAFGGPHSRYLDFSHERLLPLALVEGDMGSPPWKDLDRYLRNSPVVYADRVQTPLMIVHGDLDFVQMQQGEEFFTSLYRQGKRAQFVRYWGEGHVLESPANILDMWTRSLAWLDEFCDIARDSHGDMVFGADRVRSRGGTPPLEPEDFERFDCIAREGTVCKPWAKTGP